MPHPLASSSLLVLLVLLAAPPAPPVLTPSLAPPEPSGAAAFEVRGEAFGERAGITLVGWPEARAEAVGRSALARLQEAEEMVAEVTEALNRDPDSARTLPVDPAIGELARRALQFCSWSQGAHGPLGGGLRRHWRAVGDNPTPPPPAPGLVEAAACDRLIVGPDGRSLSVAAGSRVDFTGFARGFAVDRAVDELVAAGVTNARVELGRVRRLLGGGGEGDGWRVTLPIFEGHREPVDEVWLEDRSVVVVWRADHPDGPPWVDERSGRLDSGTWATVAVTELALDAEALAVAALVLDNREGRFRVGNLEPRPSVLWLLGTGTGRALLVDSNWQALGRPVTR